MEREIRNVRTTRLNKGSSFETALKAWNSVSADTQDRLLQAAEATIPDIFELEPLILESNDNNDILELYIQTDDKGIVGDVRDVILERKELRWEIGFSLKHNHFAVKHSRLAKSLDFAEQWFGCKCSNEYWNEVTPIFNRLEQEKKKKTLWRDIPSKEKEVYVPILRAFINELRRCYQKDPTIASKMVEYLLGKFDFYKTIALDDQQITQLLVFNLRGTLNRAGRSKPKRIAERMHLPKRIVCLDFKPKSQTTVELYMDEGWQFNFRIHNASTVVEPSLKFDIQLVGNPTSFLVINCIWK
ncbi:MAG: HaeIII family restriction endonuclease [Thermoguttaceae bacterium]|nr:HaeIII family restriction endonuclease [Thermoguttaceae bacterium]